jgi:Uma2 family endonuclease
MQEYLDNGLQLGWLIVPKTQEVEIYRRDRVVEYLESPRILSSEDILPELLVNLPLIAFFSYTSFFVSQLSLR